MNFSKALMMMLTGILAVSPLQYTNGEIVQPAGEVVEESSAVTEEFPKTATVVSGDSAIGGFSLIIIAIIGKTKMSEEIRIA